MKVIVFLPVVVSFPCCAQMDTSLLVAGDWSPIVSDSQGHSLRGRLLVYDDQGRSAANHARIYLELQHPFQGGWDAPIEIHYDIGAHNNLHFEMRNASNQPISQTPVPIRGPMPSPVEITVPCDATIRLRADNFILGPSGKPDGLEVLVHNGCWIIPKTATNDYFLSATFTPGFEEASPTNWNHWQGTLNLPRLLIFPSGKSH